MRRPLPAFAALVPPALALAALALSACASAPPLEQAPTPLAAATLAFPQAPAGPPLPASRISRIALTSCSNEERAQPAFDAVRAAQPDLVVMAGDNVYGSWAPEDPLLSELRFSYFRQLRQPQFVNLVSSTPVIPIWDDHDFGKNDGGGDFEGKTVAQAMFARFWRIPADDPRTRREGLYTSAQFGGAEERVQIIVLDARFFRSPLATLPDIGEARPFGRYTDSPDPAATVLGAAQWRWLEGELRKPARLRFIVSSYQVVVDGHNFERWGNFPAERERLFRLIRETQARGVVFLSGDRHLGAIYRREGAAAYPLFELTGSAINMPTPLREGRTEEPGPQRLFAPTREENFGFVEIDWAARTLALQVRDAKGAIAQRHTVSFGEIGAD
jgi:alkaline phosphatase D